MSITRVVGNWAATLRERSFSLAHVRTQVKPRTNQIYTNELTTETRALLAFAKSHHMSLLALPEDAHLCTIIANLSLSWRWASTHPREMRPQHAYMGMGGGSAVGDIDLDSLRAKYPASLGRDGRWRVGWLARYCGAYKCRTALARKGYAHTTHDTQHTYTHTHIHTRHTRPTSRVSAIAHNHVLVCAMPAGTSSSAATNKFNYLETTKQNFCKNEFEECALGAIC